MAHLAIAAAAAAARDPAVDRSLRSVFGMYEEIGLVSFLHLLFISFITLDAKLNRSHLQLVTTKTLE